MKPLPMNGIMKMFWILIPFPILLLLSCKSEQADHSKKKSPNNSTQGENKKSSNNFLKNTGVKGAEALMDTCKNLQVIDLRSLSQYENGHLPKASHLPYQSDGFMDSIEQLKTEATYLIYSQNGSRSLQVGKMLTRKEFKNVYNLQNGIYGWTKAVKGLEKEKDISLDSPEFNQDTREFVENFPRDHLLFLYFFEPSCTICKDDRKLLKDFVHDKPNEIAMEIDVSIRADLMRYFNIKTTPTLLIFKQGLLFSYNTGDINIDQLNEATN